MLFRWLKRMRSDAVNPPSGGVVVGGAAPLTAVSEVTPTTPPFADVSPTPVPVIAEEPLTPPALKLVIPSEKIAARAYEIWVRKGRPHGTDDQNWLEAEVELRAEYAANPGTEAPIRKPR